MNWMIHSKCTLRIHSTHNKVIIRGGKKVWFLKMLENTWTNDFSCYTSLQALVQVEFSEWSHSQAHADLHSPLLSWVKDRIHCCSLNENLVLFTFSTFFYKSLIWQSHLVDDVLKHWLNFSVSDLHTFAYTVMDSVQTDTWTFSQQTIRTCCCGPDV